MSALLAMSLYQWLIFLHVVAAMVWVGGVVTLAAIAGHILRNGDDEAIARSSTADDHDEAGNFAAGPGACG